MVLIKKSYPPYRYTAANKIRHLKISKYVTYLHVKIAMLNVRTPYSIGNLTHTRVVQTVDRCRRSVRSLTACCTSVYFGFHRQQ